MSEQVIVGKLRDPTEVIRKDGSTAILPEWHKRAMWSYLRLVHGRTIDDKIKAELKSGKDLLDVFAENYQNAEPRTLQFIIDDKNVLAVASTKHLLISPNLVYATTLKILGKPIETQAGLRGGYVVFKEIGGLKVGAQIDGGSILTRFAIRVASFLRVEMCFNPLSWLGVSGLGRFGLPTDYERVLRVQKVTELEPRLKSALDNSVKKVGDIEKRVEHAKAVSVSSKTAHVLAGAMGMAYGLGGKTIKQVMEQFKDEDRTQWGLSMAESWVAKWGKHKKTPEGKTVKVPQSLSTISGATLLLDDIKTSEQKCRQWLKGQTSKLAEDLLKGRLP